MVWSLGCRGYVGLKFRILGFKALGLHRAWGFRVQALGLKGYGSLGVGSFPGPLGPFLVDWGLVSLQSPDSGGFSSFLVIVPSPQ